MSDDNFFIIIKKVDGEIKGHAVRHGKIDKETVASIFIKDDEDKSAEDGDLTKKNAEEDKRSFPSPFPESFMDVERNFSQAMLMYRKSVVETIRFAPFFADLMVGINAQEVANSRGRKREDLSFENIHVYSLPSHALGRLKRHADRMNALANGAELLPKISVIGIISSYDAILSDLLRVVFKHRPEIIFTSDREVKFSELIELETMEAVRDSIINNEIEGVIRKSHHEQFSWMEKKFTMKLRDGLEVWSDFIELCERRNLLTHTGGVVSEQYLRNCEQYGRKPKCKVGDRLEVDINYLTSAIDIVSEVGYKLIHTLWRKFVPDDRKRADSFLNEAGMELIAAGEYKLAEKLLHFGVGQKKHSSELVKRMMIVNRANAAKLGGDKVLCDNILSSHDWSATSYQFQVCVAAVKNDFEEVKRLLKLGETVIEINSSDFRDWPVFRDARKDADVQIVFEEVFGEPLTRNSDKVSIPEDLPEGGKENDPSEDGKLIH